MCTGTKMKNVASDRTRRENVPRNIHSYLVFKIFQNVFSKAENIVFFITILAYFEKYGMIKDKSSTLQCENVT